MYIVITSLLLLFIVALMFIIGITENEKYKKQRIDNQISKGIINHFDDGHQDSVSKMIQYHKENGIVEYHI